MSRFRTFEVSSPAYSPPNTRFVTVQSPALKRRGDIVIYNAETDQADVPVIILLHGVYGSAWAWMYAGGVHRVYERLRLEKDLSEFVLVMPSDGLVDDGSGYFNRDDANYRSWVIEDVREAVQRTVSGVTKQSRLYLSGLSMGGYGALRLGGLHRDLCHGISAHSPITSGADFDHFTKLPPYYDLSAQEGRIDLIELLKESPQSLPSFRFDCGQADILFESCQSLSKALSTAGVEHHFEAFDGAHDWTYWTDKIAHSFHFFDQLEKAF